MRALARVALYAAIAWVPLVCIVWLFAIFTDDALVLKGILGALTVCLLVALLLAALAGVWRDYSPAARRLRRGRERLVGPAGRERLPARLPAAAEESSRSRSLGPAFTLHPSRRRSR